MKAKLTNQELFYFCEQFSILLHSGISCAEGIQLMLEDSHTQKGRDFFQSLQTDYEENGSFYISLHNTGLFPDSMISYVKIGEETGCLDEVLNSLSLHYQQEMEISENIKSAITYPLLMLVMMAAVILILLAKVLPVFRQVFQQMGLEMNQFSNGLFHAGSMISQYSAVVFAVILVMIAAFAVLFFQRPHLSAEPGRSSSPYKGNLHFCRLCKTDPGHCHGTSQRHGPYYHSGNGRAAYFPAGY